MWLEQYADTRTVKTEINRDKQNDTKWIEQKATKEHWTNDRKETYICWARALKIEKKCLDDCAKVRYNKNNCPLPNGEIFLENCNNWENDVA